GYNHSQDFLSDQYSSAEGVLVHHICGWCSGTDQKSPPKCRDQFFWMLQRLLTEPAQLDF
ncbi:MAG: hypothetical protein WBZ19_15260, partial [Chthoniobacterales bacterium]